MKKVSIKINDRIYEKAQPTIKDWFNLQEFSAVAEGKNMVSDKDLALETIKIVAKYVGLELEEILEANISLDDIIRAYKAIQANIIECFSQQKEGDIEKK